MLTRILFVISIFTKVIFSQDSSDPFSALKLGAFVTHNENRNEFHNFWHSDFSGSINLELPFYAGIIEAGIQYTSFSAFNEEQPAFTGINYYLNWGFLINLSKVFVLKLTAGPGLYEMYFSENVNEKTLLTEREISFLGKVGGNILLTKNFGFEGGYYWLKIFTSKQIVHGYMYIGLFYSFEAPQWVKQFLK